MKFWHSRTEGGGLIPSDVSRETLVRDLGFVYALFVIEQSSRGSRTGKEALIGLPYRFQRLRPDRAMRWLRY